MKPKVCVLIVAIALAFAYPLAIFASPEEGANETKITGISLGTFKVSANGAGTYSIPLILPPAFGPNPQLALAYDSQNPNGLLGVGWSLTGIPAIHRCPATIAQDNFSGTITFDSNNTDRFCLDGSRLMVISGTYGANQAEYRTEIDTFVRIFSYGTSGNGPDHFIVKNKAGETLEFGNSSDSHIEAVGLSSVRVWALNKITDGSGNYLTVTYERDLTNGDYRPLKIEYGGNTPQGVSPQRSVTFLYEDRPDKVPQYIGGTLTKSIKRLSKIQTKAPDPSWSPGNQLTLVREYRLTYDSINAIFNTKRSRIARIDELAWDGANYVSLPAHTFTWTDAGSFAVSTWTTNLNSGTNLSLVGDFDGDGKSDVVSRSSATTCAVHISQETSFNIQSWPCNLDANGFNYIGDFNGDGKTDILSKKDATSCYVHLSKQGATFNGFDIQTWTCTLNGTKTLNLVGDFNGDGRADLVAKNGSNLCAVHISTGTSFGASIPNWSCTLNGSGFNYVGDFNGDGLSDIASKNNSVTTVHLSTGSSFTMPSWGCNLDGMGLNYPGDFNGDGKTDIVVRTNASTATACLSTGTNFTGQTWSAELNSSGINLVGDFNGDGLSDIVAKFGTGANCEVNYSLGSNFNIIRAPAVSCDIDNNSQNYLGDFDGNGRTDILHRIDNSTSKLNIVSCCFPDLLFIFDNNLGGRISPHYGRIVTSTVYSRDNDAIYPIVDLQIPMYVVDTHTVTTGTGDSFQFTHFYAGLKYHQLGRGSLGFRYMRTTDVSAGVQTTTYFRQVKPALPSQPDFPLIGLLSFSETAETANPTTPFAQIQNTYNVMDTQPGLTLPSGEPRVRFPALKRVDNFECDGEPVCFHTAVKHTYDSQGPSGATLGNPISTLYLGEVTSLTDETLAGDERDEQTEWVINSSDTNWLHRPKHTVVVDPFLSTVLREKWLYYDELAYDALGARGLVTKEESRTIFGSPGDRAVGNNSTIISHYDPFGNKESLTDPIGCETKTVFDVTHTFPTKITRCYNAPVGQEHLKQNKDFTWDPRFGGKLSETAPYLNDTDPRQTISYNLDVFGRIEKVFGPLDVNPLYPLTTFVYSSWGWAPGQSIQKFDRIEHGQSGTILTEQFFDGHGRFYLTTRDGPAGTDILQEITYDSRNLPTSKSAPHFSTETALFTTFTYDALGRHRFITHPDGRYSETQYFPGQIIQIDERQHQKIKYFDAYGRIEQIDEKNGTDTYTTTYDYDAVGAIKTVTNHLAHQTTFQYDPLGRKVDMVDPNMGHLTYSYDNAGNLLTQIDPILRGQNKSLTFEYDLLGRMTKKNFPNATTINLLYDVSYFSGTNFPVGRLTKVLDLSNTTVFQYDDMGRVLETDRTIGGTTYKMSQAYNALTKIKSESFPDNDTVTYTYDAGFLAAIPSYINNISYNARGQKATIEYANNVTTNLDYFDQQPPGLVNFRVQTRQTTGPITALDPDGKLQDLTYDYDDTDNLTSIVDAKFSGSRTFDSYDDLNRLLSASGTFGDNHGPKTCGYTYDAIGNIRNKCGVLFNYDNLNHPSFVTSTDNQAGIIKTYEPDDNGNTKNGAGRTFEWTADNRVASVTIGGSATTMDYDYTGIRIKKFGPLGETVYPFGGYEIGPDGTKIKFFKVGNEILASKQTTTTGTDKKLYYHNDHLGGVNVITDDNGARVQLNEYDPWGKVSRSEGTNVDAERRFTGQILDPESGLYYYGGRYYDPELARFISPDPIIPEPGDPQS